MMKVKDDDSVAYTERWETTMMIVFAGSLSRGGNVTVFVKNINHLSLPTPFYSVLVSISVFVALSSVFHSINSPDNSSFSLRKSLSQP